MTYIRIYVCAKSGFAKVQCRADITPELYDIYITPLVAVLYILLSRVTPQGFPQRPVLHAEHT